MLHYLMLLTPFTKYFYSLTGEVAIPTAICAKCIDANNRSVVLMSSDLLSLALCTSRIDVDKDMTTTETGRRG